MKLLISEWCLKSLYKYHTFLILRISNFEDNWNYHIVRCGVSNHKHVDNLGHFLLLIVYYLRIDFWQIYQNAYL